MLLSLIVLLLVLSPEVIIIIIPLYRGMQLLHYTYTLLHLIIKTVLSSKILLVNMYIIHILYYT